MHHPKDSEMQIFFLNINNSNAGIVPEKIGFSFHSTRAHDLFNMLINNKANHTST